MFPDHDNPSTAAAAAPAQDSESEKAKNEEKPGNTGGSEVVADVKAAKDEATAAPVAQADGDPRPENAAAPAPQAAAAESQGKEAAAPVDAEAAAAAEEAAGSEEMSKLMEQYGEPAEGASQNEIIEVKVVAYTEQGVVVDLGQKTEGLIPAVEFSETEIPRPEPNATIEVQRTGEHEEGYLIVSYQNVLRRRTWERIYAAFKAKDTVTGKVVDRIKGGLVVDVGVRAFLPGSQFDLRPTQNLDNLLGQELQVRITKLNRRRGNVVVSRRAILEEELHSKRAALMETLTEGQVVHGHVKNVTEYGAFVDLGGIDGLLHLTDLSWGRVKHPSDVVKPEQELDVIILKFDKEKQRVSLGLKQLAADPWVNAAEKYPAGGKVRGKVVGVVDYGVFVELEQGIEGLVHVGDVSWTGRVKNPHEVFRKGEPVTAKVLKIDPENRRVSLGIKQVNDIWGDWFKSHKVGQLVKGKVSRIATFGAFVELGENIEALCHNTEIEDRRRRDEGASMHRPSTGPLKSAGPLEPGKEYDFKIIKISPETRRIGLSYRAAVKQVERREIDQYKSTTKSSSTATIGDAIQSKLSAR